MSTLDSERETPSTPSFASSPTGAPNEAPTLSSHNNELGQLRKFQSDLLERLSHRTQETREAAWLAFVSHGERWLVRLTDLREARSAPEPQRWTAVDLGQPWLLGCVFVGARAVSLIDFECFLGGARRPFSEDARVLELAERFGAGCALLVERVEGLIRPETLIPVELPPFQASALKEVSWGSQGWTDAQGQVWRELRAQGLVEDPAFWASADPLGV